MKTGQKVIVRQTRSHACRNTQTDRRLEALGLGRIGNSKVLTLNEAVIGMIKKVDHLVTVEDYKGN